MLWIVNPQQRTVSVYRPGANIDVLMEKAVLKGNEVVPGFRCSVSEIFG